MEFQNKVVIVTGIGEDAVIAFAQRGAKVVVTGRNEERIKVVVDKCHQVASSVNNVISVVADLSRDEDCKKLIDETISTFGQIDVLVNNAGIIEKAVIGDENLVAVLENVFSANVRSVVCLTNLASSHLIATKGNIINISSVASQRPGIGYIPYSVSKAAIDTVTQCSAIELGPKGVRVNALSPALIETPIFDTPGMVAGRTSYASFAEARYPIRRIGQVSDTTTGILFLASDQASFYTGVNLPADGGYLAISLK